MSSISALYFSSLCKQLYANFCWHSVSSSQQSVAWWPKWDLCCILLLTSNRLPLKASCLSNRLLANSTFACMKIWTICFFFLEETFDHVLGSEIDHVSLMFISEHESMQIRDTKWMFAYFYNPDNNSWNLFNCKCNPFKIKLNYKHWGINFVVTLGPKAEHLAINFVCKLVFW